MDIRICPNCGTLFDLDKRIWDLNYGNIDCPCCKQSRLLDNYEKVKL